jgi:transmembrane sensor
MEAKVNRLRAFGDQVARAQDCLRGAPSSAVATARARWVAPEALAPARLPVRRRRWSMLAPAFLAIVLVLAVLRPLATTLWPTGSRLSFEVATSTSQASEPQAEPGTVGRWIASPPNAPLPIRFSDGSAIHLQPASRARVVDVESNGASLVLESGAADVDIVHRATSRWSVRAGPFEVAVTGTAFRLEWDPTNELFMLTMKRGSVTVSGCSLRSERAMVTGETFRAVCHDGRFVLAEGPPASTSDRRNPPTQSASAIPLPPSLATAPARAVASSSGVAAPSSFRSPSGRRWQDLIAMGRYSEAVDAADDEGLAGISTSAGVQDLVSLGDAARFAGRPDEADYVLQRLRERFPRDERASLAAFNLGRIAFDIRHSYADAARWFGTYLNEQPSGPLAREAAGRLFEALERSGAHTRAREAAYRYLQTFPNGPHADLARSITASE